MKTFGQQCVDLKGEGLSFSQIAARLGVTRCTVAGAIYRIRNPERVKAYSQQANKRVSRRLVEKRAAKVTRIRQELVSRAHPRDERTRQILALFATGKPMREIGEVFGLTAARIGQIIILHCGRTQHFGYMRGKQSA